MNEKMISFPVSQSLLSSYEEFDTHNIRIIEEKIEDGYQYEVVIQNDIDRDFHDYLFFQESIWRTQKRITEHEFVEIIEEFIDYNKKRISEEDYYNRIS